MDRLVIDALGAVLEIDLAGLPAGVRDLARSAWSGAVAATGGQAPDRVVRMRGLPAPEALAALSQDVAAAAIAAGVGRLWMLHAGAVADAEGRVIVLVGPSGRGKTTAVGQLARRWSYVSDEAVGIDGQGHVFAFRKPLSLIEGNLPKAQRSPAELGLLPLPQAGLRLAAVVLLERDPGSDGARIEEVDPGDSWGDLAAQTSSLSRLPAGLRLVSSLLDSTGGLRRVHYGDASQLAALLEPLFVDGQEVLSLPPVRLRESAVSQGSGVRYRRAAWVDAVDLSGPDRLALLLAEGDGAGRVLVLGGVAPALWRAAESATLAELTDAVLAAHGQPGQGSAQARVKEVAERLTAVGVLGIG